MSQPRIRLALQYRNYLLPALQGLVTPRGFDVSFKTLPADWEIIDKEDIDAGEASFSRYVLGLGSGDDRLIGIPAWVMRSFRHRCILVRKDSPLTRPEQMSGCNIGLTGWPDSGHTWSRAVLREAQVDLDAIHWWIGGLTTDDISDDRLGPSPVPNNVTVLGGRQGLVDALADGALDAVFTPYMPPGFHSGSSPLRHLFQDFVAEEAAFYQRKGYVPGVHLVTIKRGVAEQHPWLARALMEFLGESRDIWLAQRRLLADGTPWELREIDSEATLLGQDWMSFGLEDSTNVTMTADFCTELASQRVSPVGIAAEDVFADFIGLTS